MDMQTNTTGTTTMVQRSCSTSSTQGFRLALNNGVFWVRTAAPDMTWVGSVALQGRQSTVYQLINRRTGKCLDLTATAPYKAVQKTCSTAASQQFLFVPTGDGTQVLYTVNGMTLGVQNGSTSSGAQFVEGGNTWQTYNELLLSPILAGEPHRLDWAYSTTDGAPCGQYDWFDIERPNGNPLEDPADTYVQLIFAGGKETLNEASRTSTGSCSASCVKVSATSVAGQCCSCNGSTKSFAKSTWNASTFLCQ